MSICWELALFTLTLGCQTTLPHGGCTVEVQGCPCLEPRQPAPPRPNQVLPLPPRPSLPPPHLAPLPVWRLSTRQGTGHTAPGSAGAFCCHLRTLVPRVLEALYPPISAVTDSGRDRGHFGVLPAVHPEHILFSRFICWSSLRCLLKNLNYCLQKDCKITVLNFKNKIFIFNLQVKLEKESNQSFFHTEKENLHVTTSQNTVHATPSSSPFSSVSAACHHKACPGPAGAREEGRLAPLSPGRMGRLPLLLPKFKWH